MAIEKIYTGYYGFIQTSGQGRFINITNVGTDQVEIKIIGDLELVADDQNTQIIITNLDGIVVFDSLLSGENISLVEYGNTGTMADGVSGYDYTIITVGGLDYIFLDDYLDPTLMMPNPFASGRSPLDGDPTITGSHDVCFVNGTQILTPTGEKLIEELVVGDLVLTKNSGTQKIVWAGVRKLNGSTASKRFPVRISADAFGQGLPSRDLLVSPQHRILISDWRAELLFGASEVLVPAKHLVNDSTIRIETDLGEFSYHHILFEKHETVFSEGLPTESFHPGDMAMAALGEETRAELLSLFSELADCPTGGRPLSHMALKGFEAKAMAAV
jgi:hypothetical protein